MSSQASQTIVGAISLPSSIRRSAFRKAFLGLPDAEKKRVRKIAANLQEMISTQGSVISFLDCLEVLATVGMLVVETTPIPLEYPSYNEIAEDMNELEADLIERGIIKPPARKIA